MKLDDPRQEKSEAIPLNTDRDPQRWAREFNKVLASKGQAALDEGWLISWFANAMMAGEDTYRWRKEAEARDTPSATTRNVWTPEQVKNLEEYQRSGAMHPFTCANRGKLDQPHFDNGIDLGVLTPTIRGWICQCCDYTQNWAHDFMLNGEAVKNSPFNPERHYASAPSTEGVTAPEELQEWIGHMDLHLTEHDERHAGLALRAAWPHVRRHLADVTNERNTWRELAKNAEARSTPSSIERKEPANEVLLRMMKAWNETLGSPLTRYAAMYKIAVEDASK